MLGMKTLLIAVLALALAGGAFLSRPSEQDFQEHIRAKFDQQQPQTEKTKAGKVLDAALRLSEQDEASRFLKQCTYKNRLLWADVEKDGKTIYTGVFSKWFER